MLQVVIQLQRVRVTEPSELGISVTFTNVGSTPTSLFLPALASPASLQVVDAHGKRVPFPPPSAIPEDDGSIDRKRLAPGASVTLPFHGASLFSFAPEPGAYQLRYSRGDAESALVSDWTSFTIFR